MSVTEPVYSKNVVLDVFEHIGHGLHVAFADGETIATKLPQYITVAQDVVTEAPTVVAEVTAVVADLTGGWAVLAAVEGLGANLAADVNAAQAVVNGFSIYLPKLKADVTTLLKTLGADEKTIAAVFGA